MHRVPSFGSELVITSLNVFSIAFSLPLLLKLNDFFSFWNLSLASHLSVRLGRPSSFSFCLQLTSQFLWLSWSWLLYSCFSLSCFLQNQYPAGQSAVLAASVITLWLGLYWMLSPVVEWRLHLLAPISFLQLKLPIWVSSHRVQQWQCKSASDAS